MTAKEMEALFEKAKDFKGVSAERPLVRLIRTAHRWSGGEHIEEKLICRCGNDIFFCPEEKIKCSDVQDGVFLIQCSECNAIYTPPYNYWKAVWGKSEQTECQTAG